MNKIQHSILLAILLVTAPSSASAGGANCSKQVDCNAGLTYGLVIDCNANDVVTIVCDEEESTSLSLARIAVRCFDGSMQARYKDVRGTIPPGFDELTQGCNDYMAAVHWLRGVGGTFEEYEAQCATAAAPDCVDLTPEEQEDLQTRMHLYSLVNPGGGASSCGQKDSSQLELRNGSPDRAYQGVIAGRYICTVTDDISAWSACDNPASTFKPRGQYARVRGFSLAPQSLDVFSINHPDPGFDNCCDFERTDEDQPPPNPCEDGSGNPTGFCSPLDVQCASAAIFGVCRPGSDCANSEEFLPISDVAWFGPRAHVDPGDSIGLKASSYPDACFHFSFANLNPEDKLLDDYTFGGATSWPDDPGCATPPEPDIDGDEVLDVCDVVIGTNAPADGIEVVTLRQGVLNEGFSAGFDRDPTGGSDEVQFRDSPQSAPVAAAIFTSDDVINLGDDTIRCGMNQVSETFAEGNDVQEVPVGQACADPNTVVVSDGGNGLESDPNPSDELLVFAPPLTATGEQIIEWKSSGGTQFETAVQKFQPRWFAYVAEGTADSVLAFDMNGEIVWDANESATRHRVNLRCDAGLTAVGSPWDLAERAVPTGLPAPNDTAVREIYAVADVTTASGPGYRLFGFDVQDHRLLLPEGVALPNSGRALYVADDENGFARVYVARKLWEIHETTTSTITAVDVETDPLNPTVVDGGAAMQLPGLPMGIRAHHFGAPGQPDRTFAYVTTVNCEQSFPMIPCLPGQCPEGASESVYLSVVDVTNPGQMSLAASYQLATREVPGSCNSEVMVSNYQNVGMEFSLDRSKLFVVNPDLDRLEVLLVPENTLSEFPITVGDFPVDVTVVDRGGVEHLYVANRTDQDVSQIRLSPFQRVDILPFPPASRPFAAIEARSDGMRVYTASGTHGSVGVIDINPEDPLAPRWVDDINTSFVPGQGFPRRIVLLRPPTTAP